MLPFFLPKSTNIASKIDLEWHLFFDRVRHRVLIDVGSMLEAKLGHVGHTFAQNGMPLWDAFGFFVGFMLFFDFGAILAPSWLHFGGVGARFFDFLVDLGVDFGRFWGPVWRFLVTIWVLCAQSFWRSILFIKIWFWMGWWGYAKRKELPS